MFLVGAEGNGFVGVGEIMDHRSRVPQVCVTLMFQKSTFTGSGNLMLLVGAESNA